MPEDFIRASTFSRSDVVFRSKGVRCAAWLYEPAGIDRPPLIIMAHGLGAVREIRLPAYAERFAAAGFASLVFDYRYFGSSEGLPRHLLDARLQREDWHAALQFARALPRIDQERIALWGTSYSGGHVIRVGAQDGTVAAVIAQCPFTSGPASVRALGIRSVLGTGAFAVVDQALSWLGVGPLLVPLVGVPGTPALMTAPDVVEGIVRMLPAGTVMSRRLSRHYDRFARKRMALPPQVSLGDFEEPVRSAWLVGSMRMPTGVAMLNGVAGRFGLRIGMDSPGRYMSRLQCPLLLCVSSRDSVAPPGPTLGYAREAPDAQVHSYDGGHFDLYVGELFERVVGDQIRFLTEKLLRAERAQEEGHAHASNATNPKSAQEQAND